MSCFIFRADGNSETGLGHVMRCLSIADACSREGYEVRFVLADQSVRELVMERGYKACVLGSDYRRMDDEIPLWQSFLSESDIADQEWVSCVVDSYYVSDKYFLELKEVLSKCIGSDYSDSYSVVYMDDLAKLAYPVDVLINYNMYGPEMDYHGLYERKDLSLPELILGADYAPLREMFRDIPRKNQRRDAKNVLISTGGADAEHLTIKLIREIGRRSKKNEKESVITYHFLVGSVNTDLEEIRNISDSISHVAIHENVSDMRGLIESCDIAVSAAGSTMYEISACGVPMITYILADNQILGADSFEELGLAVNLGDIRKQKGNSDVSLADWILSAISDLGSDYESRVKIGRKMQELIDGRGADRLVERIMNKTVSGD